MPALIFIAILEVYAYLTSNENPHLWTDTREQQPLNGISLLLFLFQEIKPVQVRPATYLLYLYSATF